MTLQITPEHVEISHQPVSCKHWLCALQMRVRRHHSGLQSFCAVNKNFQQLLQPALQFLNRHADKQPQIGGDLLIAAAPAVQLLTGFANQRDQLFFYKMVNIFGRGIVKASRSLAVNLSQTSENRIPLLRSENSCLMKSMCMRRTGSHFIEQQLAVKWERPLPLLELRIEWFPESSGPHLHLVTS